MTTNVVGDSARLFQWQMVHYIVHGGPNDPTKPTIGSTATSITVPGSTDGGYLSALTTASAVNFVTLPPVPGSQTPPAIPIPRSQQMFAGSGSVASGQLAAAIQSVTTNAGGVYLGTLPQGAWLESVEMYVYAAFSGNAGTIGTLGVFFCASGATSSVNTPGYQPTTLFPLAFLTGGGAANTLYSTEGANGNRTAFSNTTLQVGPGSAATTSTLTGGYGASIGDIDLYFCAFGASSTALLTGSAAVRIKFTGLEG